MTLMNMHMIRLRTKSSAGYGRNGLASHMTAGEAQSRPQQEALDRTPMTDQACCIQPAVVLAICREEGPQGASPRTRLQWLMTGRHLHDRGIGCAYGFRTKVGISPSGRAGQHRIAVTTCWLQCRCIAAIDCVLDISVLHARASSLSTQLRHGTMQPAMAIERWTRARIVELSTERRSRQQIMLYGM